MHDKHRCRASANCSRLTGLARQGWCIHKQASPCLVVMPSVPACRRHGFSADEHGPDLGSFGREEISAQLWKHFIHLNFHPYMPKALGMQAKACNACRGWSSSPMMPDGPRLTQPQAYSPGTTSSLPVALTTLPSLQQQGCSRSAC